MFHFSWAGNSLFLYFGEFASLRDKDRSIHEVWPFLQNNAWVPGEASLVTQLVKNPPAMQETWDRSLGQQDPLEKEMTTHSSILA